MTLGEYLSSLTGKIRVIHQNDKYYIDRLYFSLDGLFGITLPELDLSREVPSPEAGPIQVYSAGIHYGEEKQLPRPVGAIFFRRCIMNCTFCSDKEEINSRGEGISVAELGRLMDYLSDYCELIDLVNPDAWSKQIVPIIKHPTMWNTHGYKVDRSHLDKVSVVCLDFKFTNKYAGMYSAAKDYTEHVGSYLAEALDKLGSYKDGRGVFVRYLVMPGIRDYEVFDLIPKGVPVHVMGQFMNMEYSTLQGTVTEEEIEMTKEQVRLRNLEVWDD